MVMIAQLALFGLVPMQYHPTHRRTLALSMSAANDDKKITQGKVHGEGGAYVISELRMSSYKNNRLCWLPEQLIARQVKSICNDDSAQNDAALHDIFATRSRYAIDLLLAYAAALTSVRDSGLIDHGTFMNGM